MEALLPTKWLKLETMADPSNAKLQIGPLDTGNKFSEVRPPPGLSYPTVHVHCSKTVNTSKREDPTVEREGIP